jgi:hypothetical protein
MAPLLTSAALGMKGLQLFSRDFSVRTNGADHQWVEDPLGAYFSASSSQLIHRE